MWLVESGRLERSYTNAFNSLFMAAYDVYFAGGSSQSHQVAVEALLKQ